MRERGIRRWLPAVMAASMMVAAGCRDLPETGGRQPDEPTGNLAGQRGHQPPPLKSSSATPLPEGTPTALPSYVQSADRGFNATIGQIGSSIDPRTPKTDGKQNNSKWDDAGHMMQDRYANFGGATFSPTAQGFGGEDGAEQGGATNGYESGGANVGPMGWQNRNLRKIR